MESIDHMVGSVVSRLSEAASSKAVAGEPIQLGDVTLVVLSMLSIGMGAGGGEGTGESRPARGRKSRANGSPGQGVGEGAAGGGKVRPAAVIAFTSSGVSVLPIPAPPGAFDKMVERVPDVVEMVNQAREALE